MVFADQALKQVVSKPRPVSHRLETPLNPVDSDREHVDEAELLRILRQHRSETDQEGKAEGEKCNLASDAQTKK